jgi:hypothetical protein
VTRELKLVLWCDGEHDEDVEAVMSRTVSVDGGKPMLLDLCETCDKVVQDMIAFMDRGVLASKAVAMPHARVRKSALLPVRERAGTGRVDGKDRTDCPEEGCGHVSPTRSALGAHVKTAHGTKIRDYDWSQ